MPFFTGVEKARKQAATKPSGGSGGPSQTQRQSSQHGPLSAPRPPQPQKVFISCF